MFHLLLSLLSNIFLVLKHLFLAFHILLLPLDEFLHALVRIFIEVTLGHLLPIARVPGHVLGIMLVHVHVARAEPATWRYDCALALSLHDGRRIDLTSLIILG